MFRERPLPRERPALRPRPLAPFSQYVSSRFKSNHSDGHSVSTYLHGETTGEVANGAAFPRKR